MKIIRIQQMERFKDLSQLYKGYDIVKIGECGNLEISNGASK